MAENGGNPPSDDGFKVLRLMGGDALVKTIQAEDHAWKEGRVGYAALMIAKEVFYDLPVHQFSSGDSQKPLPTPSVKDAPQKSK